MIKAYPALVLAAALGLAALPTVASAQDAAPAAAAPAEITTGKMVFAANNQRLGAVYRVTDGAVQIIIDGKMKSVPASTVTAADGKYVTSLTKAEVMKAR